MSHLSREELIDSLDGPLPPARQAHAHTCARCRAERTSLAAVLRDVNLVSVPEPSPLFWERLSARVREHVVAEPLPEPVHAPGWVSWLASHRALAASATLSLCLALTWAGWRELRTISAPESPDSSISTTIGAASSTDAFSPSSAASIAPALERRGAGAPMAESAIAARAERRGISEHDLLPEDSAQEAHWGLMLGLADDAAWEDEGAASGVANLRPGSADSVVTDLTSDERRELARLLHEEMARPPSS